MGAKTNGLPLCNYCIGQSGPMLKSEWTFVYGNDPQNHYAFCCTHHIPDMIESISAGRNGEVKAGYLAKWDTNSFFDEYWNKSWANFFNKLTK